MKQGDAIRAQARSGDNGTEDEVRFAVIEPAEIVFVLRQIVQDALLVTAYPDAASNFTFTSLLAVMPENGEIVLDAAPDAAANERLIAAKQVSMVTLHDQVKVTFTTHDIRAVRYQGGLALRAALPKSVVRIQRREHYRIATPIRKPLICTLPMPDRPSDLSVETIVLDISIGGVALMNNHDARGFQIGDTFENCRIGLPEVGTLTASLKVRNAFETPLRNGQSFRRCGCQFLNLAPSAESLVQRYIMFLERSRTFRK